MVTPRLVSLGRWKTHDCTDDDVYLVCGRAPTPGETVSPAGRPARCYHCPACDIFGKGQACWGCGAADVDWGVIPKVDFDMSV